MTHVGNHPVTVCPACESQDIDEDIDAFDAVCSTCGLVIEAGMDPIEMEWKVTDEQSGKREEGQWITQVSIQNATEQRIAEAFKTLEEFADHLNSPVEIRQEAADIFCDGMRQKTTDGREKACVVAACLRVASLQADAPIPVGILTEFGDVDQTKFRRCRTALQEDLGLQLHSPDPQEYLPFVESVLDLEKLDINTTKSLLEGIIDEQSLVGKNPAGVVAAAIYLVHDEVTQASVADAVGVSTETVRQRVNQIRALTDSFDD